MKDSPHYLGQDEGQAAVDQHEAQAAADPHDKAELVGLYVGEQPLVGDPPGPESLPKRGLGGFGLRFTHKAGAAGGDSSVSIAPITDSVEIRFIGTAGCRGSNSITG